MKERGFLQSSFALYLIGISLVIWVISFLMNWIYETKEQRAERRFGTAKQHLSLHLSKEQLIKYGVGEFTAHCSGLFVKKCRIERD